jgi:S-adenosylmethionine:tRNA ribosyltransferase-isomerase
MEDSAVEPHGEGVRRLGTTDFDYPLDETLIAQRPLPQRDASRMLVVHRSSGSREDRTFADLPGLFESGDVLVLNDTRVFPARLLGQKPTGAPAEVLLLERDDREGRTWRALVRPGGKLKPGRVVRVADDLEVVIERSLAAGARLVRLVTPLEADEAIARYGHVPLPPYIRRADDDADRERYQTIYARETGSVAAPTAGLHFSGALVRAIEGRGARVARLTLHVGPGTFRPVEVENPADHRLEPEWYRVTAEAADTINRARLAGGSIWAVGTTSVRTLETVSGPDGRVRAAEGRTDLFIRPGHRFAAVDRLITNFHLPRSTLLMLVAAFAGYEVTMAAYRHALEKRYRFYSYGDSMVLL